MKETRVIELTDAISIVVDIHNGTSGDENSDLTTLITKLKEQRMKRIEYISNL